MESTRERRQVTLAGTQHYRRKSDMIDALKKLKEYSIGEQALIVAKAGELMEENRRMDASAAIFQAIESWADRRQKAIGE